MSVTGCLATEAAVAQRRGCYAQLPLRLALLHCIRNNRIRSASVKSLGEWVTIFGQP